MAVSLHVKAKFRALGITFGTTEATKDITGLVVVVLGWLSGILKFTLPANALSILTSQSLPKALTLFDDRGVFVELL